MLKIGITGGIGSGKSTVAKLFKLLGIQIFEADSRAKNLIQNSKELKQNIIQLLGNEAYANDGLYNREWVGKKVFQHPQLLQKLNQLVHPEVKKEAEIWFRQNENQSYCLYEAALMNKASEQNGLDKVISVISPLETRLIRIAKRDSFRTEKTILNIIQNQKSNEEFIEMSDFVIKNSETDLLIPQVLKLHTQLKDLANHEK